MAGLEEVNLFPGQGRRKDKGYLFPRDERRLTFGNTEEGVSLREYSPGLLPLLLNHLIFLCGKPWVLQFQAPLFGSSRHHYFLTGFSPSLFTPDQKIWQPQSMVHPYSLCSSLHSLLLLLKVPLKESQSCSNKTVFLNSSW